MEAFWFQSTITIAVLALVTLVFVPSTVAQTMAPAPAPTIDGVAVDQGIAYVLMLVALVLTYLIHGIKNEK